MRNHSCENVFALQVRFHANQTHFHMNVFARRLVLKQRHKVTRNCPIRTGTLAMQVALVFFHDLFLQLLLFVQKNIC